MRLSQSLGGNDSQERSLKSVSREAKQATFLVEDHQALRNVE